VNSELEIVWELPNLPLTGIYFTDHSDPNFEYFHSQNLLYCNKCSHLQLSKIVDPNLLYLETYTHRTSTSPISKSGNEFLLKTILDKGFKNKKQILEIGCNDIYLLKNLRGISEHRAGVDPIFDNHKTEVEPGIFVHGGFAESIDYGNLIEKPVDLVISAHTFEHIIDPVKSLLNLKPYISDKLDFIIEVPSSVRMLEQLRLDQVFSQHINYYSPKSLTMLMQNIGLQFVSIIHNYSYWGGTQILHFSNYQNSSELVREDISKEIFNSAKHHFLNEIENIKFKINNAPGRIFAYGAAQMLPILQYHLGDTFELISEIFDDNPERIGKNFPFDLRNIRELDGFKFFPSDTFLITALDSAKPLIKRLIEKNINLIILPIGNI